MCERHISYIFCVCVRAACVTDRLCERAQDSYSMHVRGSMRGRQKEGGELKCCLQEPPLQGQMASTAQPGPAAGRSSLVSPQTPGVWEHHVPSQHLLGWSTSSVLLLLPLQR